MNGIRKSSATLIFSILFAMGAVHSAQAALAASAQLSGTASNDVFNYTLTLINSNASTANIETFWFSWVPGEDFMAVNPTNIGTPSGWTDEITHASLGDGYAIQFVTSSAPLAPGDSLTFTFTSASSPAIMAGNSPFYSTTPIGTSFVYSGQPEEGLSDSFVVQAAASSSPTPSNLLASAQLSGIASNGEFNYTLTLVNSNASDVGIETFWYSWVPLEDFMTVSPTNIVSPAGWTDKITNAGTNDGYAIQFVTSSAPLAPGGSLTFTFASASSPATMAGDSPFFPGTPIGTSFVYSGAPFIGSSNEFVVETVTEPVSTLTNELSFSFTDVVQACKTKVKIDKKTATTNTTETCKLSLELLITNLGVTNSPAFDVLVWAGQGSNFDSSAGLPPTTEKVKALKLDKVDKIKLKDTFNSSQSGTFIYCTDTNLNVITSVQIE